MASEIAGNSSQPQTFSRSHRPNALLRWLGFGPGVIVLALRRMRHQPGLTLLALLGIILSVGLITNASFFSQAVDTIVMREELNKLSDVTGRPAFSTRIYTLPSSRNPLSLNEAEVLGQDVAGTLSTEVGLPISNLVLQVQSEGMMLQPDPDSSRYESSLGGSNLLLTTNMIFIDGVAEHIRAVAGEPYDPTGSSGEVIDVWMHTGLAERMGVDVGETFGIGPTLAYEPMPVRVVGIWEPIEPEGLFWFNNPNLTLREKLLIRRADFTERMEPLSASRTGSVGWYIVLDESRLNPDNAVTYVDGFERGMDVINKYVPGARLDTSPLDPLREFVGRQSTLTVMLLGFNLPAFGFLLYFLILTSAIIARWQSRETATLMSRGMSTSGILGLTLVEELLLFVIGYPLGVALGLFLARIMGYTESFLVFTQREPLPVSLAGANLSLAIIALGVALIARLWPTVQAARTSVVEQSRERSRNRQGPFWYRYYLDILLLVPTLYTYNQLSNRESLAELTASGQVTELYDDPLLVLLPALFVLTGALLTMRIFPWLMRLIDVLANLLPAVSPHLALRQMGRQGQNYINPLLLVIISLALGIYTYSMAASLDQWLVDRVYYAAGTDMSFTPFSLSFDDSVTVNDLLDGEWVPLPSQFEALPGVASATRVGNYAFETDLVPRQRGGPQLRFMAVDRTNFASVSWFREDFATEPMGGLMNRLALAPQAVLVPQFVLDELNRTIGEEFMLRVRLGGGTVEAPFIIAGTYTYFPTVYDDTITIIGNLDYLTSFYGIIPMHDVWLDLEPGADSVAVEESLRELSLEGLNIQNAPALISEAQSQFERVGIFGTLTIGFIAAAVMAGIGLLINTYASLQDRLYRFAVLHAIGLRRRQIITQVILEYGTLTAYGAIAGSVIGALTAQFFVPFFRITGENNVPLPPLIPLIAEQEITVLALTFAVILIFSQLVVIANAIYGRLFGRMSVSP